MASIRYIILSLIYIIDYYLLIYKKEDSNDIYHNPTFVFFISTFIFMFIIKYNDNKKCTKNKLSNRYFKGSRPILWDEHDHDEDEDYDDDDY